MGPEMKEAKRKRGRPTVGLRVPLSLRVTPESKRKLDAAAEKSGRSQSQEAEFRLERSFDRTDLLDEVLTLAFRKELAGLLLILGIAMADQGRRITDGKGDWTSDSVAYDAAVFAAMWVLDCGRPDGSRASASDRDVAARWVEKLIQAINDGGVKAKEVLGHDPRGDAILRLAGPIAKRMSEALPRMRGQLKHHDSHSRPSSRKMREAD
jgi:TraY domain